MRTMTWQVKLTAERETHLESKSAWQAQATAPLKELLPGTY